MFSSQYETEMVKFSAGQEGSYLRPGDVFNVMDKTRTQKRFGGRVTDFVDGELKVKVDLNLSNSYIGETIHITIVNDFEFSDALDEKADKVIITADGKVKQGTVSDEDISKVRKSQIRSYRIKDIEEDTSVSPIENRIVELEALNGDPPLDFGKIKIGSIFILSRKGTEVKIQENLFKVVNVSQKDDLTYNIEGLQYVESKFGLVDNEKNNAKASVQLQKTPVKYSRPAKPIGVPRVFIIPVKEGLERELTVSWEAVEPTPYKYKIVISFGLSDRPQEGQQGSKIVLEKKAKDPELVVVDTSVSVNIGDYSGEIDVSIYTIDSKGNLDLIYY